MDGRRSRCVERDGECKDYSVAIGMELGAR